MRRKIAIMINSDKGLSLMYAPALCLFLLFVAYPLVSGIQISFTNWNGYSQKYSYIGLDNYSKLMTDVRFTKSLLNTLIYGFGSAILQNFFGILYALLLNMKFRSRILVRTIVYMPVIVAQLIMGYIWYFLVQYDGGAINDMLAALGFEPVDWMAEGSRAVWIITGINAFQYVGTSMIIYLAGIQSIPQSLQEAATIDGANGLSRFRHITLPLLIPAITTSFMLNLIGGLELFAIVISLTSGGPGFESHSMSSLINYFYFENQNAGYAAAIGLITFVLVISISYVMLKIFRKREVEY
ncbi:carbohydrate ABC transporter permease [Paenibacillus radicis (ex Xue et al. 2023)]|uniref:Sugar ABC transporter permease n=1 Tax=Paenibacillus radicis (ex Xue et al. 2023) TaxID=2972489 RepID=A0ABT1YCF0_9BACL|nr:sugar ABC transporter permease [Paenibacillus radicis (ex Xue et al. 2023)]MCR8630440.1 sugar ABC transporter permease [Paenibacillus radicis (ex Xue et al. 2023)]